MFAKFIVQGNTLRFGEKTYRCAIGWGGFSASKREGDGATPIGSFALRECWYRPDRMAILPETKLPLKAIQPDDGWCDDPKSPHYNCHVKLPFSASHEKLWLEEEIYDLIVPLGYNDERVIPGAGSAIFLHLAHSNYAPTQGCVALQRADLLEILKEAGPASVMEIVGL